eukprot:jgi/Bigna1/89623/estExt_fgenesh1_pg.C_520121
MLLPRQELTKDEIEEALARQLRELLGAAEAKKAEMESSVESRLDMEIRELGINLEQCERILRHPIPTSYTRHTSRLVSIWTITLPLALWPMLGPATLPATLVISYSMLAIEDIGVMIEEPFDILPLWKYAEDIDEAAEIGIDAGKRERRALLEEQRRKAEWTSSERSIASSTMTPGTTAVGSGLSVASTGSSTPMSSSQSKVETSGGTSGSQASDNLGSSKVVDEGSSAIAHDSSIGEAQDSSIATRRNPDPNAPPPPY